MYGFDLESNFILDIISRTVSTEGKIRYTAKIHSVEHNRILLIFLCPYKKKRCTGFFKMFNVFFRHS